jgi:hypothetical protein
MARLNSTVMALSPLGKRRGGGSGAAMASECLVASGLEPICSVFCGEVEFASYEISLQVQ